MTADLLQIYLYCAIGQQVSARPEKGTAVAAAEYLCDAYFDASGLSPRNLCRTRELFRTYEHTPKILAEAVTIGRTQNVVLLDSKLTLREQT